MLVQPMECAEGCLQIVRIARPGIQNRRQANVFVEDDHVARFQLFLPPGFDAALYFGLRHGQGRLARTEAQAAVMGCCCHARLVLLAIAFKGKPWDGDSSRH